MFFSIDADTGRTISGWIAPDNPSHSATLRIASPGYPDIAVIADLQRDDIRSLGVHNTGATGFLLTPENTPGIEYREAIEIVDVESGLLLYRRFDPERHVARKLFLFDSALMPQKTMMAALTQAFAQPYLTSERISFETMLVLINNPTPKSCVFHGRSNFNRYRQYLEDAHYLRAAILRDPFEELAERLLFLKLVARSNHSETIAAYTRGAEAIAAIADRLDLKDPKSMVAAFRELTDAERLAIASPMVRMLACDVDEAPARAHVSAALENLATMDVVGTRRRYAAFRALLDQTLEASVLDPEPPPLFPAVAALAQHLTRIGAVADCLQHDVALYAFAEEAVLRGLSGVSAEIERDTRTV